MTAEFQISWVTFARLLVLALLLDLLVRGLRRAVAVAPMSAVRRTAIEQAFPIVELSVGVLYLVAAVQELFRGQPAVAAMAVAGVLFGALWLMRAALMDFLAGVFLRGGENLALGDHVRLDGIEGRVCQLGYRGLTVETSRGDEALIPYSRMSRQAVIRRPRLDGACRHSFRLSEGSAEQVRELAMLCHWASAAREPIVDQVDGGGLEITIFALAADRGQEVEAFVRRKLDGA